MIDKNGFSRPTYNELVEDGSLRWKELFGENAQTNTHSVGGILIRMQAYFLDKLYQMSEAVYNSQFVDSAVGTTLDQLAANVGLTRNPSSTAIGTIHIYGKEGYIVPTGTMFRTKDGLEYVTSEDIILVDTGKKAVSVNGKTYNLADGDIGYGKSEVLYANGYGSEYNKTNANDAIQVTPSESVFYVYVEDLVGGADLESDESLRSRIDVANQTVAPSSPYNGLLSSVKKVVGVKSVKIVSNDTMVDDAATNTPAKSIHLFVDGGTKEGIAEAIFDSLAAGVVTVGNQSVNMTDIAGGNHVIKFDYPHTKDVYALIKITKNSEYPLDGDDKVREIVMEYINSVGMGGVVHYSYLYNLIYSNVTGVTVADIKIGTDENSMSAQDITMTNTETAQITSDKVVIA